MSQAHVEIARRAVDALNQSDLMVGGSDPLPTLREFCDPDVEWGFSRRGVDPEIYHGYEGWLRIAEQFGDAWLELHLEIDEIIDAGENVVLFTNMVGLSKSGIKLSQSVGQVWTFREWQDRSRPILRRGSGSLPRSRGAVVVGDVAAHRHAC